MTQILVHNGRGDSLIFTAEGRMIGPHQTETSTTRDQVTARLLVCGRLTTVDEPQSTRGLERDAEAARRGDLDSRPLNQVLDELETESDEPENTAEPDGEEVLQQPARSASKAAWADYAVSQGYTRDELDGLKRDEIRDLLTETTLAGGDQSATEATPPGGADPDSEEEK